MAGTSAGAARRARCPQCGMFQHASAECPSLNHAPPATWQERVAEVQGAPDECWVWTGDRQVPAGYALLNKRTVSRLILGLTKGDGLVARHTCDNPPCVNPAHLVSGTTKENSEDMVVRRRSNVGERHHNAELTWEDVRAIRADPRASPKIAPEYGVSARHIRKIRAGLKWPERENS